MVWACRSRKPVIWHGLRAGEQYKLTWGQVDFERRQIALYQTKNGRVCHIPMNQAADETLQALYRG